MTASKPNSSPAVSIIIPWKNRPDLVKETIDSVKMQSFCDFECILVDDGSDDDSKTQIRQTVQDDDRFIVRPVKHGSGGGPAARNEGLRLAQGRYLMFLDSDDLLAEEALQDRVRLIEEAPGLEFIVTQQEMFKYSPGDMRVYWSGLDHEDDVFAFLQHEGWQTSATFFRRSFVLAFQYAEAAVSWQDVEFHLRILLSSPSYRKFPWCRPHVFIRRSEGRQALQQLVGQKAADHTRMRMELAIKLEDSLSEEQVNRYGLAFRSFYLGQLVDSALKARDHSEVEPLLILWSRSRFYSPEERSLGAISALLIRWPFERGRITRWLARAVKRYLGLRVSKVRRRKMPDSFRFTPYE